MTTIDPTTMVSAEYPDDTDEFVEYKSDEELNEVVDNLLIQIGNAGTFWQEGFNVEAWTSWLNRKLDRAELGDMFCPTVAEAGPMETQDAEVEVVFLEPDTVAYRYSTHAQDDDWQMGSPEDAVERAKECYDLLHEQEEA